MLISFSGCSDSKEDFVSTPSFVGLTLKDAQQKAKEVGLQINVINDAYNPLYDDGVVIEQSVHSDVMIAKNGTITLLVNNSYWGIFNMVNVNNDYSIRYYGAMINGGTPSNIDKYLPWNTYVISSINPTKIEDDILFIPKSYNDTLISGLGRNLLNNASIKTLVIPETISFIDINLCGWDGVNYGCTSLEKIICLGEEPFYLGSLALSPELLAGGCKIYVPEDSVDKYKQCNIGDIPLSRYADLIYSINELDSETKSQIDEFYKK